MYSRWVVKIINKNNRQSIAPNEKSKCYSLRYPAKMTGLSNQRWDVTGLTLKGIDNDGAVPDSPAHQTSNGTQYHFGIGNA